jgi:hypothetical protein
MSILALNTKTTQIDSLDGWMNEFSEEFMKDIDKYINKIERTKRRLRKEKELKKD